MGSTIHELVFSLWRGNTATDLSCAPKREGDHSRRPSVRAQTPSAVDPVTNGDPGITQLGGIPVSDLLSRVQHGDQEALGICYEALFPLLWRIAVARTRDADVAEDAVQDVFVALWNRRDAITPDMDLRTYLATAVINRARDVGKHQRVVAGVEARVKNATLSVGTMGQPAQQPDHIVEARELRGAYQEALCTLNERERIAVLLRWEEDLTFDQIAQVLGSTKMGARHIFLKAQQKVHDKLLKYGE